VAASTGLCRFARIYIFGRGSVHFGSVDSSHRFVMQPRLWCLSSTRFVSSDSFSDFQAPGDSHGVLCFSFALSLKLVGRMSREPLANRSDLPCCPGGTGVVG